MVERCAALLGRPRGGAMRCRAVIDTGAPSGRAHPVLGVPFKGPLARMTHEELTGTAREFVLAFDPRDSRGALAATWRVVNENVPFSVMPDSLGCVYPLLKSLGWREVPVLRARGGAAQRLARAWKRAMDIVVAALGLVLAMPAMLVVAALIRLESPGPAIFTQERVGKNGRVFRILKFRTMVADASAAEERVTAAYAADPRFVKIACDPRLTRLGCVLRRTSIDELPQLWNILRGDMSLVGPRPSQPREVDHYEPHHFVRLLVKPGLTGMWQVSGRSEIGFEEAVELDAGYVRGWSSLLDLKILAKTGVVVLRRRGAC